MQKRVKHFIDKTFSELEEIINSEFVATAKLNMIFQKVGSNWVKQKKIMKYIYFLPGISNRKKEAEEYIEQRIVPVLSKVIKEGIDMNLFNTIDPDEAGFLVFKMGTVAREDLYLMSRKGADFDQLKKRARSYTNTVQRILGARADILDLFKDDFLKEI